MKHLLWLERQKFNNPHLQAAFDSLLRGLSQTTDRLRELERLIEEAAKDDAVREPVALLSCFKGVRTTSAMVLVTELYDIERFPSPRKLMNFLGLTPGEHSSAGHAKRGGITKAGNGRLRKVLVESVWTGTRSNHTGRRLRERRDGQPGWAVDLAERAQHRFHKRFWRLVAAGKHPNKAIIACAREFVGFIWAMLIQHRLNLAETRLQT